jgi:hypothetical protein
VPEGFEENLEQEICWMFRTFYETAGTVALADSGWTPSVVVEPSWEDASTIVVLAQSEEAPYHQVFLLQQWYKAWHFQFTTLEELAETLRLVYLALVEAGISQQIINPERSAAK